MSSNLAAGKETLSYCSKCQLTLAHMIVVMKSPSEIGKVKCKTCGATHSHKDPTAKPKAKAAGRPKSSLTKSGSSRKTKSLVPVAELWRDAITKATGQIKAYSPRSSFINGDVIEHASFGQGIVQKLVDGNKIEVMFQNDVKTLVHNIK